MQALLHEMILGLHSTRLCGLDEEGKRLNHLDLDPGQLNAAVVQAVLIDLALGLII